MALGTDLATAQSLQATVTAHGVPANIQADAAHIVTDLAAQIATLQGDLAGYQALKTALVADGGNAAVMADVSQIINDLTVYLS